MTFLPIVERELRAGARKPAPRYIRLVVAAVALLIGLFQVVFIPLLSRGSASGGVAFGVMTGYAFALCLGAGVFIAADCLSEEKRGGTLGLLFLTDLRGHDVVLGKLAAQVVHLGYALLAIIPGAALPLLLGGITGGELWRISLALINLLFFSLAAGILASAICREAGQAMLLTAGLLLVFCLGLPLAQSALSSGAGATAGMWLGWASPALAYLHAGDASYLRAADAFWTALGGSHAMAWGLIGIASGVLPRSWQDRAERPRFYAAPAAPSASATVGPDATAPAISFSSRNPKLLDEDPLLWLIGERRGIRAAVWAVSILWVVTIFLFALASPMDIAGPLAVIGWIGLLVLKLLFVTEACRFFTETRRAGAFELLLATPINANRFVSAQWNALRKMFGPPLLVVTGGTIVTLAGSIFIHGTEPGEIFAMTIFGGLGAAFVLVVEVLDFFALGWLGMWLALTMRKPQLAAGATILYVLILPGITTCYSFFVGFILDIILIAVFASKLQADFRQVLTNRPLLLAATPGSQA